MSVKFTKPDGELRVETECYRSLNLLAHAQLEELDIGSECGGHGKCGKDRVRPRAAREQLSPVTELERKHLSEDEIAQGWRLGCQCWPARDGADFEVETTTSARSS